MEFVKSPKFILAILAILAAAATFTVTTTDDSIVQSITDWYKGTLTEEVVTPDAVVPVVD